jgi:hypothetical protein
VRFNVVAEAFQRFHIELANLGGVDCGFNEQQQDRTGSQGKETLNAGTRSKMATERLD